LLSAGASFGGYFEATSTESVVEQVGSDVDRGPALLGGHLLDQLGQLYGEINCKICKAFSAAKRGQSGDHISNGGIADAQDLIF
jgi:hypothetical protein